MNSQSAGLLGGDGDLGRRIYTRKQVLQCVSVGASHYPLASSLPSLCSLSAPLFGHQEANSLPPPSHIWRSPVCVSVWGYDQNTLYVWMTFSKNRYKHHILERTRCDGKGWDLGEGLIEERQSPGKVF